MNKENLALRLRAVPLIAIARNVPPELLPGAARALLDGGFRFLEVTMNSEGVLDSIRALKEEFAGTDLAIGAGTVLTAGDAKAALEAGAEFLVCPHTDAAVIRAALEADALPLPGVMTPTEVAAALAAGAEFLKLFPAGALGPGYVKALRGPFDKATFLAVGGVDETTAPAFLKAGCVGFGLGSTLLSASTAADPETLRATAARWTALVTGSRS